MATQPSIEDLIARSRRGPLDESGRRRLESAIAASQESRLLYAAGAGFDAVGATLPDDDLIVSRVADRVANLPLRRKRRGIVRSLGLVMAGVSLASAAAAAGWIIEHQIVGQRAPTPTQVAPVKLDSKRESTLKHDPGVVTSAMTLEQPVQQMTRGAGKVATANEQASLRGDSTRSLQVPASSSTHSNARNTFSASSAKGTDTCGTAPTDRDAFDTGTQAVGAAEQFARASRARREGRSAVALGLYLDVTDRFPTAPEAGQAQLAAAELLLQAGQAQAALDGFRRARVRTSAAEALWGEARALRALRRVDEEHRALTELTERYPQSPYAEAARKRLDESL